MALKTLTAQSGFLLCSTCDISLTGHIWRPHLTVASIEITSHPLYRPSHASSLMCRPLLFFILPDACDNLYDTQECDPGHRALLSAISGRRSAFSETIRNSASQCPLWLLRHFRFWQRRLLAAAHMRCNDEAHA